MLIDLIVFFALFLLLFIHILYPLLIFLIGALRKSDIYSSNSGEFSNGLLPSVTLIIAAYNEENVIAEKLENTLSLNYPKDKLEVIVTSDASDDKTDEIVKTFNSERVKLNRVEGRVGKTASQNNSIKKAEGDIIVFSDANSFYSENAIFELVKPIMKSTYDCTIGKLEYFEPEENNKAIEEGIFAKFMHLMKKAESHASMPVGANGSIYAVKKSALTIIPDDSLEDLLRPLIVIKNGGKVKYVETAVAKEELEEEHEYIFYKKQRIAVPSVYTLRYIKEIFNPFKYGFFSFQVFYKVLLRRMVYPLLILLFIGGFLGHLVLGKTLYLPVWALVAALFLIYWINKNVFKLSDYIPFVKHIDYYVSAVYGAFTGLLKGLSSNTFVTWNTSRN